MSDEELFYTPHTDDDQGAQQEIERMLQDHNQSEYDQSTQRSRIRDEMVEAIPSLEPNLALQATPKLYSERLLIADQSDIAKKNLIGLQELISILQTLEVQHRDLDGILAQLLETNEQALIHESQNLQISQTQTLYQQQQQNQTNEYSPFQSQLVESTALIERNRIQNKQNHELLQFNSFLQQQNSNQTLQIIHLEHNIETLTQQMQLMEENLQLAEQEKAQIFEHSRQLFQFAEEQLPPPKYYVDTRHTNVFDIIKSKIHRLIEEKNELQGQVNKIYAELDMIQQNNDQIVQENNQLQDDYERSQQQNEILIDQINKLSQQNRELQDNQGKYDDQIDLLQQQNSNLLNSLQQAQDENSRQQMHNQNMMMERQKDSIRQNMEREKIEKILNSKDQELNQLREEFQIIINQTEGRMQKQRIILQKGIQELQEQCKQAQSDRDQLSALNDKLDKENRDFKDRIRNLEQSQQLILTQHQENIINQWTKDKDYVYQKQKAKMQELEHENIKLNKQNMDLQMKISQIDHEKKLLRDIGKDKQYELDTLKLQTQPQIEYLKQQHLQYELQIQQLKRSEADLEQRLIILENEKQDLELQLKRHKKKINQL